jgi:N-acetylglutamate synthase-like GNAT family acetyltransferase
MPTIRPTRAEDLTVLGELLDGIFRRPRGITDQSMLTDFPLVFAPANWRNGRVVFEDGRLVAHAALWRREAVIDGQRLVVGVLVSVATHPDYRNRGYAAEAVKSLQTQMQEEQYDLGLLWTGVPDFYLKLGWELAECRGTTITLQSARLVQPHSELVVTRFDPQRHAEAVYALHQREVIRFLRSPEDSRALFALPKIETWVATRAGEVIGYLVHATGCNKRGLIEYGGDLEAIVHLAGHVARSQPVGAELTLLAYHVRPDLVDWARRIGLPLARLNSSKGSGHEMILQVNGDKIAALHRAGLFTWGLDQA